MATHNNVTWAAAIFGLYLFAAPGVAAGQTAPSAQATQGPMTVERVTSGWAVEPELKFAEVDKKDAWLLGGYGGWVLDRTLLIGGGGYWQTNGSSAFEMAYGGAVVEWMIGTDRPIGFSARGLFGGGSAKLPSTVYATPYPPAPYPIDRDGHIPVDPRVPSYYVAYREYFLIGEPQANLLVRLTDRARLSAGISYRLVGSYYHTNSHLDGPTASIGVQFGSSHRRRSP